MRHIWRIRRHESRDNAGLKGLVTMTQRDEYRIVARAASIYWFAALTICPACARSLAQVHLQPEQDTTLHVGQTAAVHFGSQALYTIGSGGGSLVLIKQLTNKDGSEVYVYRAAHVGPDTLVATPAGLQAGQCVSCVTTHYFIKVVP
jgi:hypothetical protein